MTERALVLFDDRAARGWLPFALTRPIGELRYGALTLRERAERVLGARCLGHLTAEHLDVFEEPGAAPVLRPDDVPRDRDVVYLSSRAVLEFEAGGLAADAAGPLATGGEVVGCAVPAGAERPTPDFLLDPAGGTPPRGGPARPLPGSVLAHEWDLISGTPERIRRDVEVLFPGAGSAAPTGVHVLGQGRLVLGDGVTIEPGVVLDLRDGPIWLDDSVELRAFTRLAGPACIGRETLVLGGAFEAVSIGPTCRVHGQIECSVLLGYSNKAHAGFLGHSYLGSWVNLGAMTTNSDLKNNYGSIDVWTPNGEQDTGELKLGCLLGDHVKTGIGTLLNTGSVIGAGANLFGAAMPPKHVPPFSWGSGADFSTYDLGRFLNTAETVMARRGVELTERQRELLRRAHAIGRAE